MAGNQKLELEVYVVNKHVNRLMAVILCLVLAVTLMSTMVAGATDGTPLKSWFHNEQLEADLAGIRERQAAAHDMAEAARALGMEENCDIIQTAKQIWHEADKEAAIIQTKLVEMDERSRKYNYELFQPTNLSAEAFDYLLDGSKLAGHGQDFYELEQTYQVNGLFALAVAKVESGLGSSKLAVNKNNYYGMIGNSFNSPHDGILAFGRLMNKSIYHGKPLNAIARIYCPPTAGAWAATVTSLMGSYWAKLS